MKNILVIKLRYIGDVLLCTPVLQSIKKAFPNARLTVAVNPGTEDMLAHHPSVDEVLVVEKGPLRTQLRFLSEIRRRRFDCVVDLTDGDRSALLAWLSGAPVRIGFNDEHRWRGLLYTEIAAPSAHERHRIDRDLAVLRPLHLSASHRVPTLEVTGEDEREADRILQEVGVPRQTAARLIMLQPGARYWFKAWPEDRFVALADRLSKDLDCHVLVGGDQRDAELAERISHRTKASCTVLAGRATLRQFAALLKRCMLFVGNDSGAMHIAAAVGTPLVALFGPSDPAEWGPCGELTEVIYKGLDCRICFHPTCRRGDASCMRLITVEEVYAAVQRVLSKKDRISGCA